jgi:hypothetical protein
MQSHNADQEFVFQRSKFSDQLDGPGQCWAVSSNKPGFNYPDLLITVNNAPGSCSCDILASIVACGTAFMLSSFHEFFYVKVILCDDSHFRRLEYFAGGAQPEAIFAG